MLWRKTTCFFLGKIKMTTRNFRTCFCIFLWSSDESSQKKKEWFLVETVQTTLGFCFARFVFTCWCSLLFFNMRWKKKKWGLAPCQHRWWSLRRKIRRYFCFSDSFSCYQQIWKKRKKTSQLQVFKHFHALFSGFYNLCSLDNYSEKNY